jgi:hypothetical protein
MSDDKSGSREESLNGKNLQVRGKAFDDSETFDFSIEPFVTGGFRLDIKYFGGDRHNITGAGVWPTVEKAREIAEATARRLLHGTSIQWQED